MKSVEYLAYGAYNKLMLKTRLFKKTVEMTRSYGKKTYISAQQGNDRLSELLQQDNPFMAARFGANELAIMRQCEEIRLKLRKEIAPAMATQFCNGAGFFPNQSSKLQEFSLKMRKTVRAVDLCGVWFNPMENYFIKNYNSCMTTTPLIALEPWYHENPWTRSLVDKQVLVVHPFADTIQKQYEKREMLFFDGLLPEFTLHTLKAVQTIAGNRDDRFGDWFEALDYMFDEAMKIDHEVAILGCGAYGFLLAAKLKEQGKKAIHLGGPTQLLFGIKGKRWDDMPAISRLYNENWVRPSDEETVKNNGSVENGCYW